jgi:hypothetical protein
MNSRLVVSRRRPSASGRSTIATASVAAGVAVLAMTAAGCAGVSDPTGLFKGSGDSGTAAPAPAAAAATLPERGPDTGPAAPTAVVEDSFTMDGAILPVARGQSRVETRADMRRTDSALTFDNWLIRRLAGDGRTSDIVRVDRKLVWTLDPAKKVYTECPITGCAVGERKPTEEPRPDQPAKPSEPTCPVVLKSNDLKVDSTGERRTVNGFATERFQIAWTIELEDNAGRRSANRVQMDLWTTPETGPVRDVQAITDNFQRRYAAALSRGDSPIARYLPPNVAGAMSSLMKNIDPKDQRTLTRWGNEMKKVRGYPIVTTLSWTTQGAVCTDSASGQPSPQAAAAGIGGMLSGMLGGKKADGSAAPAPLISFNHEVRSIVVKPVADNVFLPPADFQRRN